MEKTNFKKLERNDLTSYYINFIIYLLIIIDKKEITFENKQKFNLTVNGKNIIIHDEKFSIDKIEKPVFFLLGAKQLGGSCMANNNII